MESRGRRRSQRLLRKGQDPASSRVLSSLSITYDAGNWPSRMERIIGVAKPKRSVFNKRKTHQTIKRLGKGRMTFVLRFPLDVFIEIASYLSVLDLLSLSYASWDLHGVMLSKSFRPIWCEALEDIGAPKCTSGINEPQLVDLVFCTFCHGCGARVQLNSVDYGLRVRLCSDCSPLNLIAGSQLFAKIPNVSQKDKEILRLCYYQGGTSDKYARERGYFHYDFDADFLLMQRNYFAPDFEDVARQYMATASESVEREKFIQGRKKLVNDICCHVRAIVSWLGMIGYRSSIGRTPEACLRAYLRRRSILTRLKSLGYSDGDLNGYLDYAATERWKKILEQPHELTERVWSRIYPEVKQIIFKRRAVAQKHFLEGIRGAYKAFANNWAEEEEYGPILNFEDVKRLPEVQSIIEGNGGKKSLLSVGERASILELLPGANAALEAVIRENCVNVITAARESAGLPPCAPDTPDMLNHASTFFLERDAPFDHFIQNFVSLACSRDAAWEPLTPQCPKVIKIASALLRSLNLPDNSTLAEMEHMGQRFVCRRCKRIYTDVTSWQGLVYHFLREAKWYEKVTEYMATNPSVTMEAIDSHNVDSPGELAEVLEKQQGSPALAYKYQCIICKNGAPDFIIEGSYGLVICHIRASHGKPPVPRFGYEILSTGMA